MEDRGGGRQLPMGTPGAGRRAVAPLRSSTAAARAALQQSMRAEGKWFALCIADGLELERLAERLGPSPGAISSIGAAGGLTGGTVDSLSSAEQCEAGGVPRLVPSAGRAGDDASSRNSGNQQRLTWARRSPTAIARAVLGPAARAVSSAASVVAVLAGHISGVMAWAVGRSSVARSANGTGGGGTLSTTTTDAWSLSGAELVRVFGTGESMVLQIKLFRGKDLFAFRFGAVVCWGFAGKEREAMAQQLRSFAVRTLPRDKIDEEVMEFVTRRKATGDEEDEDDDEARSEDSAAIGAAAIRQDQIILTTNNPFERLAHSYALAQSVRLGVFEVVVDASIAQTRSIPETMATTGEVVLDERELSKQIGGLLMLRCDVNLHTDILDTPDIFWDEERFEPHYVACRGYLDIDKRVDILNQRLGVLKDLYDLLQNTLNVKHGNKLEWIIIILILVEVVLELLELVHDAWSS